MVQACAQGSRLVIVVQLDLSKHERAELGWRAKLGIEMSQWCQQQGLAVRQNYDWSFNPHGNSLQFRFYETNETFATMFALRWSEYT